MLIDDYARHVNTASVSTEMMYNTYIYMIVYCVL